MNPNETERMQSALTPKQRRAALLLASGDTGRQVAKTIGVTPQTVSEWNALPAFRMLVGEHLAQAEGQSLQALHGLRNRAVERLGELLESSTANVVLRTAQTVLEMTAKPYSARPISQDHRQAPESWQELLAELEAMQKAEDTNHENDKAA